MLFRLPIVVPCVRLIWCNGVYWLMLFRLPIVVPCVRLILCHCRKGQNMTVSSSAEVRNKG